MAEARGPRFGRPSAAFGAYLVVAALVAFYLSPTLAGYVDPSATAWILATYILLGALALIGVCVGALRRGAHLDAVIEEEERMAVVVATMRERAPPHRQSVAPPLPSDRDVDQLLEDLDRIGAAAAADPAPDGASEAALQRALDESLGGRAIARLRNARSAVARAAAGPALASLALVGLFAALLPGADGMLNTNLRLNAFVGVLGVAWLAGIAGYAGAAFHRVRAPKI